MGLLIIANIISIMVIIFQRKKIRELMDEFLMAKMVATLKDRELKRINKEREETNSDINSL